MAVAAHQVPRPAVRILVVEDEHLLRAGLRFSLARFGYEVEEAATGEEALEQLRSRAFDLVLLDIHLPGIQGVELMQCICRLCPDIRLIILTGQPDLESAIGAVKCRAVDYLIKPVGLDELLRAISRALQNEAPEPESDPSVHEPLRVGGLTLDRETRRVLIQTGDGRQIAVALSPSEVALLAYMMEQTPAVCSYTELAGHALGYHLTNGEARELLRPHICRLRRKIAAHPGAPELIHTVVGKGYRLEVPGYAGG